MEHKKEAEQKHGTGDQSESKDAMKQQSGGREFGNVIEPMQAQMASENKGLAADVGNSASKPEGSTTAHKKKPAA